MKEPIGIGVVGAGAIGIRAALSHLSQPDVQDRVRLAAVCDPVPGRAAEAAKKYGVAAHYETYEELLGDPNVEAVTLCSPIGLHYAQGMAAIAAGKHVHFNKTITTRVDEADRLIARAKEKGMRIVASPGQMLFPHNRRIRKRILEGALGRLSWAITGTSAGSGTYHLNEEFRTGNDILTTVDPSWYFQRPGGGPQYDVTVYCLHNLTGILGPARRVTAMSGIALPQREYRGRKITCDMDDSTFLLLDFGETVVAFVFASVAGQIGSGFQPNIYGTQAAIIGTSLGSEDLKRPDEFPPHVVGPHKTLREFHVFEDMMQLADWIRNGTPSIASAEHARHVIDIIESGYRAAETGQAQELRTTFDPLSLEAL